MGVLMMVVVPKKMVALLGILKFSTENIPQAILQIMFSQHAEHNLVFVYISVGFSLLVAFRGCLCGLMWIVRDQKGQQAQRQPQPSSVVKEQQAPQPENSV